VWREEEGAGCGLCCSTSDLFGKSEGAFFLFTAPPSLVAPRPDGDTSTLSQLTHSLTHLLTHSRAHSHSLTHSHSHTHTYKHSTHIHAHKIHTQVTPPYTYSCRYDAPGVYVHIWMCTAKCTAAGYIYRYVCGVSAYMLYMHVWLCVEIYIPVYMECVALTRTFTNS